MDWVFAVERAYVAAATGGAPVAITDDRTRAAVGAVASRYLAVGTPRTLGLVIANAADRPLGQLSIDAHATWFAPRELRWATVDDAGALAAALASDIVCIHAPLALAATQLRRGTHVNALHAGVTLDAELAQLAHISRETPDLAALAAGLVDGRQLDEITVFLG